MRADVSDTIVLCTEKSRASIPLLRLIIGGVAAGRNVGVDQLDDLQLAVETLVVEERSYEGELTLEIRVEEGGLCLRLDGLCHPEVKALLGAPGFPSPVESGLINVRMLLGSLVDAFAVDESGGEYFAVRLEKWIS